MSISQHTDYLEATRALDRMWRAGFSWSGHEKDVALLNTGLHDGAVRLFGDLSGLDRPGQTPVPGHRLAPRLSLREHALRVVRAQLLKPLRELDRCAAVAVDYRANLQDGDRPVPITDQGTPIKELFG